MKGFSGSNLKYMVRLASEYSEDEFRQAALVQITRYHNITLIQKVKDKQQRLWYAQKVVENGRSRNTMIHRIESGLFERE